MFRITFLKDFKACNGNYPWSSNCSVKTLKTLSKIGRSLNNGNMTMFVIELRRKDNDV